MHCVAKGLDFTLVSTPLGDLTDEERILHDALWTAIDASRHNVKREEQSHGVHKTELKRKTKDVHDLISDQSNHTGHTLKYSSK